MELFQIYVDEDAVNRALVFALRSRGLAVTTASDAGLTKMSDDGHLAYAMEHGCVLFTFNSERPPSIRFAIRAGIGWLCLLLHERGFA